MKKIMAIVFFALATSTANAGGSIGGGSGVILELATLSITRDQFEALVLSGTQEGRPVTINDLPAKVRAVNFQLQTVELDIEGFVEPTILKAE